MEEKLREFFEAEISSTAASLEKERNLVERNNICWYALQRGLGAVQLAQMCGMKFQDAERMYEEYKLKLEVLTYEM